MIIALVEAVQGHMVLLSGLDLVDGTPVLDIKPYLPYCESIEAATVPDWVKEDNLLAASVGFSPEFVPSLANCWVTAEKRSLYASPGELQSLIKQVLSWDIRSLSQRIRPHTVFMKTDSQSEEGNVSDLENDENEDSLQGRGGDLSACADVTYHLMLEDFDISYKIDGDGNVLVEMAILSRELQKRQHRCNYSMWQATVL